MQRWRGPGDSPGGGGRRTLKWVLAAALLSLVYVHFVELTLPPRAGHPGRSTDLGVPPVHGEATGASPPASRASRAPKGQKPLRPQKTMEPNARTQPTSKRPQIVLLGERHSGTNWITDHLSECFSDNVKVGLPRPRFKHWFQDPTLGLAEGPAAVVALFRDPYDWVEAMRVEPHHALDHVAWPAGTIDHRRGWHAQGGAPLPWRRFVTKPWTGRRGSADAAVLATPGGRRNASCMAGYSFGEVVPCSPADSVPVFGLAGLMYELQHDGSERAYSSIVDLRRDKILNHLSVADFPGTTAFLPFRFEDLVTNGTASLLKSVEEATGMKAKCRAAPGRGPHRRLAKKQITKHEELPDDFIRWMDRFVDWEVEGQIGYSPRTPMGGPPTPPPRRSQNKPSGKSVATTASTKPTTDPAKHIVLLGERHTGTNWITKYISECFRGDAMVTNRGSSYKHWFQEEDPTQEEKSAVAVALFRDPYDWVEAMRAAPHHAYDHIQWPADGIDYERDWRAQGGTPLPWKEFVTKPWERNRDPADRAPGQSSNNTPPVRAPFLKGLGDYKYERRNDGSGRAYSSIIELRRDKILNHLSVANFPETKDFLPFRFEDLIVNGTASLLKSVEEVTGLKANCEVTQGQHPRRLVRKIMPKHSEFSRDYIQWMNSFVDWEVENLIGYTMRKSC